MARPQQISDDQILSAAREAFIERGIQVSTAEIARRAGVSEGTIFRRFQTKHELFMAAMDIPREPAWFALVASLRDDERPLELRLDELGRAMVDFFLELLPKVMLISTCGVPMHEVMFRFHQGQEGVPLPARGLKLLASFFHDLQLRGELRQCDPEIVARMFMGSMHHFAFSELNGINAFLPMPPQTYLRGVIDALLRGAAAPTM